MKRFLTLLFLTGCAALCCGADGKPRIDAAWRNGFRNPETLEKEWKFDGSRFLVPRTTFFQADEPTAWDGKIMVVEAKSSTGVMLTAPAPVNLQKTPVMRWRWRLVHPLVLEEGAEEPDDQPVVIYFGDGTLVKQKCVGYRWEYHTPVGTQRMIKYAAGMMTVSAHCVANKNTPVGQWIVEERDVLADFMAAYGEAPNEYFIVSVGGNSQYSGSNTRAEIDFIEFVPRRKTEVKK